MQYIVYKITNLINDKIYIGQTTESLKKRFSRHCGYQKNDGTYIHNAIKKYGKENFIIEQIDIANSQEELDELEYYWINQLNSFAPNGYNLKKEKGKSGGDTLSNNPNLSEISEKISNSKMGGKNPNSTKIIAINILTKEEFLYESMADCQRELDIPRHDIIMRRCLHKIKKPYNDVWLFEYIN